jgi:hypothetical protein
MQKTVYDIVVVEEYREKNTGRERTMFHRAGVAFSNKNGSIDCKITPGMGLTGNFVILPRKDRAEGSVGGAQARLQADVARS